MANKTATSVIALNAKSGAPDWVHLLPLGDVVGRDGRKFYVGDAEVELVLKSIATLKQDLPIDYDHHIDIASDDVRKPAAGWIVALEKREDGIWGKVDWTDNGKNAVSSREYRYLSPAFMHSEKGKKPIGLLIGAALVNQPNFYLKSLNKREDDTMDKKAICKMLGIDESSSDEEINTALAAHNEKSAEDNKAAEVVTALCTHLGLEGGSSGEDIVKAINTKIEAADNSADAGDEAGEPDPSKYVPMDAHKALQKQVNSLTENQGSKDAELAVNSAIKDGRLSPAQRDWALSLHKKDSKSFDEFVSNQPQIINGSQTAPVGKNGDVGITAEQKALCKNMGISQEDFLKTQKNEMEGAE